MVYDALFVISVLLTVFLIIQPKRSLKVIGFIILGVASLMFKRMFLDKKLRSYDPNRPTALDVEEARVERINRSHVNLTGRKLI